MKCRSCKSKNIRRDDGNQELQNNQRVKYRIGKHGEHSINWGEWKSGNLYVARRVLPIKRVKFSFTPNLGDIITLTIRNENCAEFSQQDFNEDGVFNCEEWNLEIEGLQ